LPVLRLSGFAGHGIPTGDRTQIYGLGNRRSIH
jgi:hypothetical protein